MKEGRMRRRQAPAGRYPCVLVCWALAPARGPGLQRVVVPPATASPGDTGSMPSSLRRTMMTTG